jgi:hypothetical protein
VTTGAHRAGEEQAAAGGFVLLMAALLGGAGVVIAALAVGLDRWWGGRPSTGNSPAGGGGWWASPDEHRAWLERDRTDREAWREARRKWWANGANPEEEPARPSWRFRLGNWARRNWARAALGVDDFRGGFRDGWAAANDARRRGAKPGEVARTRPTEAPEPTPTAPDSHTDESAPTADPTSKGDDVTNHNHRGDNDGGGYVNRDGTANPATPKVNGSAPTSGRPAPSAPGDTNLDLAVRDLDAVGGTLAEAENLNDQGARTAETLERQVARAAERVQANGGSPATQQALDEAQAVASRIRMHVAALADLLASALDASAAARSALRPAEEAQDSLHASGTKGEMVATATAD